MLIAVKNDDRIYVGISGGTNFVDMTDRDIMLPDNLPFWKVRGANCYVGTTNSSQSADLFRYAAFFKDATDGRSIIEKVIPKMKKLNKAYHCQIADNEWCDSMLIVTNGKMFELSDKYTLMEFSNFISVSNDKSLDAWARSVLAETANMDMDATERILTAYRHISHESNLRLFPLAIYDTKTGRRKIYYK